MKCPGDCACALLLFISPIKGPSPLLESSLPLCSCFSGRAGPACASPFFRFLTLCLRESRRLFPAAALFLPSTERGPSGQVSGFAQWMGACGELLLSLREQQMPPPGLFHLLPRTDEQPISPHLPVGTSGPLGRLLRACWSLVVGVIEYTFKNWCWVHRTL